MNQIWYFLSFSLLLGTYVDGLDVLWAVNAGGNKHTDSNGITYQADPLQIGESSDYGKALNIRRVAEQDQILYQTERYHLDDFSYTMPIKEDGDYVLVLKFSEVYWSTSQQKVFNVRLNDEHEVVEDLDIFDRVGQGAAHDEVIPFKVKNKQIIFNKAKSPVTNGKVKLTLVKGDRDNPKLNAAYLIKGTTADVPVLEPIDLPDLEEEENIPDYSSRPEPADDQKRKHTSGPKVTDPYAHSDQSSMLIPVAVVLGAFIPLLYCLCKI